MDARRMDARRTLTFIWHRNEFAAHVTVHADVVRLREEIALFAARRIQTRVHQIGIELKRFAIVVDFLQTVALIDVQFIAALQK